MKKILTIIALIVVCNASSWANNLTVSTFSIIEQNVANQNVKIQFNISWDNSWRTSTAPNNWDAVWLFIKYKKVSDGLWYHATLSTTNTNHSTGSQATAATISPRADGKGAYFYRSANGTGTFSSNQVKLCWQYGADGIGNSLASQVSEYKVFAVEMVNVPQGAFYLGTNGSESNCFYTYDNNNYDDYLPFHITNENAINVGEANGYLAYKNGQFGGDLAGPIPTEFPKGYNAFYCMKYEITQEQYAEFLNTLTSTQKQARFPNQFNINRHYIKLVNGKYGCDANNNGVLNEENDGQNVACNYLNWADATAYSDWASMRPMTELEYEKACRGTLAPVQNEFAWGNANIINSIYTINNSAKGSEGIATNFSTTLGNCSYDTYYGATAGLVRAGIFAANSNNSGRVSAGATFYGIMEMTGNISEIAITVGNSVGRSFTGLNGDGTLDANGNANVANWPTGNAIGTGLRGGSWLYAYLTCFVSDRFNSVYSNYQRDSFIGFRCVSGL